VTTNGRELTACKTCELIARRDAGDAPMWDAIHRTDHWDLVHAYNSSLPGWLVLVARRHIAALADLNAAEAAELGPLIQKVSAALHEVTGCHKTYLAQFAEHPDHPHVHLHLVARRLDDPPETRGPAVFAYIDDATRPLVDGARMNDLARRLQAALQRR